MAKGKGSLFSLNSQGRISGLVFKRGHVVSERPLRLSEGRAARTPGQLAAQARYLAACAAWHALPADALSYWQARSGEISTNGGFSEWLSWYLPVVAPLAPADAQICCPGQPWEGDTLWDASPQANHVTRHGPAWVDMYPLSVLSFDGVDDYAESAAKVSTPEAFSVLCWWKRMGNSGGATDSSYHLLLRAVNGHSNNRLAVDKPGNILVAQVSISSKIKTAYKGISNVNSWHMLTSTHDGSLLTAWVDSVTGTPVAAAGAPDSSATKLTLGRGAPLLHLAHGVIAMPVVFDYALSQAEISAWYNLTRGYFGV